MSLLIHAGIHRTGTTSLQQFFANNRAALAAQSMYYPGKSVNHQRLAWDLLQGKAGTKDVRKLLAEGSVKETAILSGEDFSQHTTLAWLAPIAAERHTRAVFYIRRQDHWLMSWYNQHIKWPFNKHLGQTNPKQFLKALDRFHWIDYHATLDRWADVLGEENVHVEVVESGQVTNVIANIIDLLKLDRDGLDLSGDRHNDSLPVESLEIARNLQLQALPPGQRERVVSALRHVYEDKGVEATTVFSPEERIAVLDRFRESNSAVAERWLGRSQLFFEADPDPDDPYWAFPALRRERLLREWIAPLIHELLAAPPKGQKG